MQEIVSGRPELTVTELVDDEVFKKVYIPRTLVEVPYLIKDIFLTKDGTNEEEVRFFFFPDVDVHAVSC